MSHPTSQSAAPSGSDTPSSTAILLDPPRNLAEVEAALAPLRRTLVEHELYRRLSTPAELALFTEHHVFAVWDSMCLLKALQRELTSIDLPWVPTGDAETRRLINELVLAKESDRLPGGRSASHVELYLEAMQELGADTATFRDFLDRAARGGAVVEAVTQSGAPCHARSFVQTTWRLVKSRSLPMVAAAYVLGRADVLPVMLQQLAANVAVRQPDAARTLSLYLERQAVAAVHAPDCKRMLERLLGNDRAAWADAYGAARASLKARVALWDGVLAQLGADAPAASVR